MNRHAEQTRPRHGRCRLHRLQYREPPSKNNDVIAVDDCYLGTPENLSEQVEFVNKSVVEEDPPHRQNVVVFHLAALSSYKMHEENPQRGPRQRRGIREHN